MAARTTRQKIKDHTVRINDNFHNIYAHMKSIEELSAGGSDIINEHLRPLALVVNEVQQMFIRFFDEL